MVKSARAAVSGDRRQRRDEGGRDSGEEAELIPRQLTQRRRQQKALLRPLQGAQGGLARALVAAAPPGGITWQRGVQDGEHQRPGAEGLPAHVSKNGDTETAQDEAGIEDAAQSLGYVSL